MEAAIALEKIELGGANEEESTDKEEACSIPPNLKLSPGMSSRHPGGNQGWKEGQDGQGGRVHGQGGAQVQGVAHQHGQGDDEQEEDKGAWRSPVSLPPLPSSPSTSGRSSSTSSSSTPMIKRKRPPRVVTTPLWKMKSISRMPSSGKKKRAAVKRLSLSQSQNANQEGKIKTEVKESSSSSTTSSDKFKSHIPVMACPGSSK
jgi:hypothetical protein